MLLLLLLLLLGDGLLHLLQQERGPHLKRVLGLRGSHPYGGAPPPCSNKRTAAAAAVLLLLL